MNDRATGCWVGRGGSWEEIWKAWPQHRVEGQNSVLPHEGHFGQEQRVPCVLERFGALLSLPFSTRQNPTHLLPSNHSGRPFLPSPPQYSHPSRVTCFPLCVPGTISPSQRCHGGCVLSPRHLVEQPSHPSMDSWGRKQPESSVKGQNRASLGMSPSRAEDPCEVRGRPRKQVRRTQQTRGATQEGHAGQRAGQREGEKEAGHGPVS